MAYEPYSRTNQRILEGAVVGVSFYLAFLIRYDGAIPPYYEYQFWALLMPMIAGRLLINFLGGLDRIQWRYISFRDGLRTSLVYVTFSAFLLLVRFGLPAQAGIIRIPASVIIIELLLSLVGAMGIRLLRRNLYELQSKDANTSKRPQPRRLLLIGAGMMGANAAKELASDSSVHIVGFLDDDPRKLGCVIAGVKVLAPTSELTQTVRTEKVEAVLVCIAPAARGSFDRLIALLDGLPVTSKFVPTITEILDSKDGLHLAVGYSDVRANCAGVTVTTQLAPLPQQRSQIRNKCVFITGGAGFIGSTLAERLAKENQIILLDRFFRNQPVAFTSLHRNPNVRMVEADILEGVEVADLARQADIVIHAAAIVGVGRVCSYPRETLETNFTGTSRILKALDKSSRLERFVYFSTSEVFGVNSFRVNEDTPTAVGPAAEARWSYAIAKLAGEHLVKAYHRQGGMPVVTVRPFNVFGPRRLGAHAILGFVLNSLMGNPIEIHGDGSQIRSWCYIDDFCDGIIEMIARPNAIGEDFNIGNPQNTLTILQLAREVIDVTGKSVPIELIEPPFPDIEIRVPSLDKARQILDYEPSYDLRQALELTTEWYRENLGFFEEKLSLAATASSRI
jgi:nucleoside-diphosphate-sugar epimerase/NADH/NAD ratio-sensing transcriptional regulator Rex